MTDLADRLEWALRHPLTDGREDVRELQSTDQQRDGRLLLVTLAVDR